MTNKFPDWIIKEVNINQIKLNPKSKDFFDKLTEDLPHFEQTFLNIPEIIDIGILKSYDPTTVQSYYGFQSPIEFILLNICETFHFQTTYHLRELGLSLFNALNDGKFYVSALLNRSILEVVCINYYTFRRIENQFKLNLKFLQAAAKTKSKIEQKKMLDKYYAGTYEIFSKLFDANISTSIDWQKYMQDKFKVTITKSEEQKRIHVQTAIQDIEKTSGLRLEEAYSILSEFVHPNLGSKMLIVNTRNANDSLMDSLTLGGNKSNSEAALFYFDHLAESMFYTVTLALSLFDRGQKLIINLDNLSSGHEFKTFH